MDVRPDLAGFVEAQDKLRQELGEDIVFLGDVTVIYAPGVQVDAQTGRAYDPMVNPVSSGVASAAVRCGVTFKAINRAGIGGESEVAAVGVFDSDHVMLNAPLTASAATASAVSFVARGDTYKITARKLDGIGILSRLLIFGRRR